MQSETATCKKALLWLYTCSLDVLVEKDFSLNI